MRIGHEVGNGQCCASQGVDAVNAGPACLWYHTDAVVAELTVGMFDGGLSGCEDEAANPETRSRAAQVP